ncbi:peptidyl-prolyl cis-trans isomerase [uncultured Muriicola sp.]|uniref:peptidyl-prolyl cis-trans isomerase n=1 Tax=uncultured Muriicola sp. TaxID=1583102 RepID=UPI0026260CC1|nr:peptidyl-prolyl cis-trans isomerase [uncultured Muriicola sp.]
MIFPKKNLFRVPVLFGTLILAVLVISCDGLFKKEPDSEPLARVGGAYLYKEDIESLLIAPLNKQDSASLVTNYINNWAIKQLLFSKAQINLTEEEIAAFERLVANYRIDLFTRAYKEALVLRGEDTTITDSQLQRFYEEEKENFILKEKLVQLRFVQLPKQFLNKNEVIERLKRFEEGDKVFLDSIGVQFTKLNFNDSLWITVSRIIQEIPPLTFENEERYLKKSQFFELEDSVGVYLGKIAEVRNINEIAPLTYIKPTIRQVLLNRRKLEFMRRLETEILDEAVKRNEFEIYEKEK